MGRHGGDRRTLRQERWRARRPDLRHLLLVPVGGASGNVFRISDVASQWKGTPWGAHFNGDALGSITVEATKMK